MPPGGSHHDRTSLVPDWYRILDLGFGVGVASAVFGALMSLLAINTTFRPQMPVESVHPREGFLAALARIRADIQVQCLMALAIVLTGETLLTARPFTFERPFLIMGPHVASQIEMPRECTPTTGHRANEVSLCSTPIGGRGLRGRSGHQCPFDSEYWLLR